MRSSLALPLLCLALLAPAAAASTWIVDDDGGPSVDFTEIAQALTVAGPGDVVLVRPGTYASCTLGVGLTVLGEPGVVVAGTVAVVNVPPGPRAVVSNLRLRTLSIQGCAAPIVADALVFETFTSGGISVSNSADVRLHRVHVPYGANAGYPLSVVGARVELSDSIVLGRSGQDQVGDCCGGTDGQPAVHVGAGALLHVSHSTVRGGSGGNAQLWFFGGDGAEAILVDAASARLLVTGAAGDVVQGGQQGIGDDCPYDGSDAPAIVMTDGWVRTSGAAVLGRTALCGAVTPAIAQTGGTLEQPVAPDAALSLPFDTVHGTQVTFTLTGTPGAAARLRLGRQPVVVDLPGVVEDRLTNPLRSYDLGTIPPSGTVTFPFNLPPNLPAGFLIVAQASAVDASGTTLSQSVPIVLR